MSVSILHEARLSRTVVSMRQSHTNVYEQEPALAAPTSGLTGAVKKCLFAILVLYSTRIEGDKKRRESRRDREVWWKPLHTQ